VRLREVREKESLQQIALLAQAESEALKTECAELKEEMERRIVIHRQVVPTLPTEWLFPDTYPSDKCPKCQCREKRIVQSDRNDIIAKQFDLQCKSCHASFGKFCISEREWQTRYYRPTKVWGGSLTEGELLSSLSKVSKL
jgi:hypothetical protein